MTKIETYDAKLIQADGEFENIFKNVDSIKVTIEYQNDNKK
jgi:hypothetical protein